MKVLLEEMGFLPTGEEHYLPAEQKHPLCELFPGLRMHLDLSEGKEACFVIQHDDPEVLRGFLVACGLE